MKENIILKRSFDFAVLTVEKYKLLTKNREFIMSKQLLRSGTSIGANVREAMNAQSTKDFIHKLFISQKECDETIYWIELLMHTGYLSNQEMNDLHNEANQLMRIIRSIILTTKKNHNL